MTTPATYGINGRTQSLAQWGKASGKSATLLWKRIHEQGMTLQEAMDTPISSRGRGVYSIEPEDADWRATEERTGLSGGLTEAGKRIWRQHQ